VIVVPTDHNRLYATEWFPAQGVPGGLFRYDNGTWTHMSLPSGIPDPLTVSTVAVDPNDGRRIVIGTSDWDSRDVTNATGVWLSEDGGATWSQQNRGLGMLRIQILMFNPNQAGELLLGTDGQGFYKTEFGSATTASAALTATPNSGGETDLASTAHSGPVSSPSVYGSQQASNGRQPLHDRHHNHQLPGDRAARRHPVFFQGRQWLVAGSPFRHDRRGRPSHELTGPAKYREQALNLGPQAGVRTVRLESGTNRGLNDAFWAYSAELCDRGSS
jgi:hypothetical protein